MAFLKDHKPTIEEEQNILKALNNQQPLSDDVKKRLQKLNNQLNTILKPQKMQTNLTLTIEATKNEARWYPNMKQKNIINNILKEYASNDIFESWLEYCEDTMSLNNSFQELLYQTDTNTIEIPTNGDFDTKLYFRFIEQHD